MLRPRATASAGAVVGLLVATAWLGCGAADPTITISLDEADLQAHMDRAFPYDTTRARTRVILENPGVVLETGSDRLGLSLDIRVDPPLMDELASRATVTGSLRYEHDEAALYLDEPRIAELHVGDLRPETAERVRAAAEPVVRGALRLFPIYRLERRSLRERAAEHVLRSVIVRDGRLHVELGLRRSPAAEEP